MSTHVTHQIDISAPATEVYRMLADVTEWPVYFPPTVRAVRLSLSDDTETIRLWATANGRLRTWVSQRRLDPISKQIVFTQTEPQYPVQAMSGTWRIADRPDGACTVFLDHDYRAVDDDPMALERIEQAVDANSTAELASLQRAAQRWENPDLLLTFQDSEVIAGPVEDVYDFIYDLDRWPDRIPHVQQIEVTEDSEGLQYMQMDTRSPDGSVHTTASWRVCTRSADIVYKQVTLPAALQAHTGEWSFEPLENGQVRLTSKHTVIIDPEFLRTAAPAVADLTAARVKVRSALGANSRATMAFAKAHVEASLPAAK